jgi:hypothetical protein
VGWDESAAACSVEARKCDDGMESRQVNVVDGEEGFWVRIASFRGATKWSVN